MKGVERILVTIGMGDIVGALSSENLNWADFHTLLLHILEKKIGHISSAEIMRNYTKNRFSIVGDIAPRDLVEIDRMFFGILPGYFSAVELSPVNPIGANATLTTLDPKVVLSTIRNVEVVGDPSMALAIECAYRRRSKSSSQENPEVHLATSHRVLRLQNFPKDSELTPHFRAFALTSSARDTTGFNKFELTSLLVHLEIWLNFLMQSASLGYGTRNISVALSHIGIVEELISEGRISREEVVRGGKGGTFNLLSACSIDLPNQIDHAGEIPDKYSGLETYIRELQFTERQIIDSLRSKYPHVHFYFDLARSSGLGYYSGLCYRLAAQNVAGGRYPLAGGGACDWTKKLLNNGKEHLIAGGFGTELFSRLFKETQQSL
ncbi:MAG: hypothetical protein AAB415_00985 [Patescibacteria group bacterium]